MNNQFLQMYLSKFGYMEEANKDMRTASLLHPSAVSNAIAEFQRFAGLNETGELDNTTIEWMHKPRCGVKDIVGHGHARKKRYALQGKFRFCPHLWRHLLRKGGNNSEKLSLQGADGGSKI